MLVSFALDFNSREEMKKVADKLWKQLKITGETEMVPLDNGKWRLIVHSEKQLRQTTIESLEGELRRTPTPLIKPKTGAEKNKDAQPTH
ncbi:MAG: hypothetical protein ACOYD6_06935 [Limnochordia bacterium]|jgi:hypothetical protein